MIGVRRRREGSWNPPTTRNVPCSLADGRPESGSRQQSAVDSAARPGRVKVTGTVWVSRLPSDWSPASPRQPAASLPSCLVIDGNISSRSPLSSLPVSAALCCSVWRCSHATAIHYQKGGCTSSASVSACHGRHRAMRLRKSFFPLLSSSLSLSNIIAQILLQHIQVCLRSSHILPPQPMCTIFDDVTAALMYTYSQIY